MTSVLFASHVLSAQLRSLDPRRFEELVVALIKESRSDATHVGANDDGVDVWVPSLGWGLQCKRYSGAIDWSKCEASLQAARRNYDLRRYTFVFPLDMSGGQQRTFDRRLRSAGVDHWGVTDLRNLLERYPQWTVLLGGPPAVHLEADAKRPEPSLWFTGRDEELRSLSLRLDEEGVGVIHGLAGIGKTELATAWVDANRASVAHTWWLDGRDSEALRAGVRRIGRDLGADETALRADDVVATVSDLLQCLQQPWTLVLDDVMRPEEVRKLARQSASGRVLITSLYPHWSSLGLTAEEIQPLQDAPAAELLGHRSGRGVDTEIAAAATQDLGGLPLALIQVGAYLEQRPSITTREYRAAFAKRGAELLARTDEELERRSVATVWSLSIEEAADRHPAARTLLDVLAYLAPDRVPLALFGHCGSQDLTDPVTLADAVAALHAFSLIRLDGPAQVGVHRLVQLITRSALTRDDAERSVAAAAELMLDALPVRTHEHEYVPAMRPLIDHVLTAADHAADRPAQCMLSARLLSSAANFARITGSFQVAKELFARAVDVADASPRCEEDRNVVRARMMENYASICAETGDYDSALPLREKALRIREAELGADNALTVKIVGNLAGLLSDLGRPREALPLAKRAWEHRRHGTPEDRAWAAHDLAEVLLKVENVEEALEFSDVAVTIFSGPDAGSRGNLAWALELRAEILLSEGRLEEAERDAHQALQVRQAAGEAHIDVARAWLACALVSQQRDNPASAYKQAQQALQLTYGEIAPGHPDRKRAEAVVDWATARGSSPDVAPATKPRR